MAQTKRCHGLCHASRLFPVDCLRLALGNRAEAAATRADVPQKHERSRAVVPALTDIGALGGLANRVQTQPPSQLLQVVEIVPDRGLGAQPFRLGLADRWRQIDLYQLWRTRHLLIDFTL